MAAVEMDRLSNPDKTVRWCVDRVVSSVKAKWSETNPQLVLIKDNSIVIKVTRCYEKAMQINNHNHQVKAQSKRQFIERLDHLFDILVCQCSINLCSNSDCNPSHCNNGAHITCRCQREFKIPSMELRFIKDQRDKVWLKGGEMLMGAADKKEARRQEKLKQSGPKQVVGASSTSKETSEEISVDIEPESDGLEDMEVDVEFAERTKTHCNQNRTDLSSYIAEVCRYGVSDRAGAALYNAALRTVGVVTDDDTVLVVDKNKIRRARDIFSAKQKTIRQRKLEDGGGIQCIGTDGKRNQKTKVCEIQIVNGEPKKKYTVKPREHIAYTQEPGGEYLCHSEVDKGTGRGLADDFMDVVAEHDSEDSLDAIVADGTPTNTGWKEGMIDRPCRERLTKTSSVVDMPA